MQPNDKLGCQYSMEVKNKMKTIKIKARLMERKESPYILKLREELKAQKHVQSRLKNGDLYDMKELEKAIFDDDYYMREIQRFRDQ